MNKLFARILPLVLLIFMNATLVSCNEYSSEEDNNGSVIEAEKTLEKQDRPTDWVTINEGIDLLSTMTVDVMVDFSTMNLTYKHDSNDIMAAFIDGTCRAVASPTYISNDDGTNGHYIFALTVKKLQTDKADAQVTLKLYSTQLQHVFTNSQQFSYVSEGTMGTLEAPYKPEWTK